jgi:hypothetical protein
MSEGVTILGGISIRRSDRNVILENQSRGFGNTTLFGTVTSNNTGPLRRRVHLFLEAHSWRRPGNMEWVPLFYLATVWSDPVTGYWEFRELDPTYFYTVKSYDNEGEYSPSIMAGLSPSFRVPVELGFVDTPIISEITDSSPAVSVFNLVPRRSSNDGTFASMSRGFGTGKLRINVSSDGGPLRRWVHLFLEENWRNPGNIERVRKYHIGSVRSASETGLCEFRELDLNALFTVEAYDIEGNYPPVTQGGLIPEPTE